METPATELSFGEFRLLTDIKKVKKAYDDDDETCLTLNDGGTQRSVQAVIPFQESYGYRGRTTDPSGFSIEIFHKDGALFVRVLTRKP